MKYIYSCTIGLASEFMKKVALFFFLFFFYIKRASLQIWVKKVIIKNLKKEDRKTALANEIPGDSSSLQWPV